MHIAALDSQLLEHVDLEGFVESLGQNPGLTSLNKSHHELMAYFLKSTAPSSKHRFWVVVQGGSILGCAALKYHERSPYYCLKHREMRQLENVVEFCSLYLRPNARGYGLGEDLTKLRLAESDAFCRRVGGDYLTVEVRAEYVNGLPKTYEANKHCWYDHCPTPDFNIHSLCRPLVEESISVNSESVAVQRMAEENGFSLLGLNAYDNGPHYFKKVCR